MNRQAAAFTCVLIGVWLAVTVVFAALGTASGHITMEESFLAILPWTGLVAGAAALIGFGLWLEENR